MKTVTVNRTAYNPEVLDAEWKELQTVLAARRIRAKARARRRRAARAEANRAARFARAWNSIALAENWSTMD